MTTFNSAAPLGVDLSPNDARSIANTIRFLSIDAVQKANSGHPGAPMGLADIATAIWSQGLKYDPADPSWSRRDRFVLSCGHASMLLYSLLHLYTDSLSMSDLKSFRQLDSLTPGHPELGHTPGVEMTTGPLGQGCATSVGMAVAASRLDHAVIKAGGGAEHPWSNQKTVVLCSDGDLMEGVSYEAASLAGHWRLKDLIWFYDDNQISIDGETSLSFTESVGGRFISMGWRVLKVNGHDIEGLNHIIAEAWATDGRPTLVICRTHIGYGSPNKVDSSSSHGSPLGESEIAKTREALGWSYAPFVIPKEVKKLMVTLRELRTLNARQWRSSLLEWRSSHPEAAAVADSLLSRELPRYDELLTQLIEAIPGGDATRKLSNQALIKALELYPKLMGGSADLSGSNGLSFNEPSFGDRSVNAKFSSFGRILHFGVREHAMGAITNGLTVHGSARGFNGTFLVFSDYLRPAIRLAALSGIPSAFVLTHDSIFLGEDGPTHQPVEHPWALRMIPNVIDFRPADGLEVASAWAFALSEDRRPSVVMLTRQNLPELKRREDFDLSELSFGAYLLETYSPDEVNELTHTVTFVGTGSEVALCVEVAKMLSKEGYTARVVSMPSIKLFMTQSEERRREILGEAATIVTVEAGSTLPWAGVVGGSALHIGVDTFGASAPMEELADRYGLTASKVFERTLAYVSGR